MVPLQERIDILEQVSRLGVKEVAKKNKICYKRINRWLKNGPKRKKGAGRKPLLPALESKLVEDIEKYSLCNKEIPKFAWIQERALDMTRTEGIEFIASKGWKDKFMKRHAQKIEAIKYQLMSNKA